MAGQFILYREQQRFKQFWLWVVILGTTAIFWAGFIYQVLLGGAFGNRPVADVQLAILFALIGVGMPWFFYKMKLTTEVRQGELQVRFWPFHARPVTIPLHLVRDYEKITYNAIRDYGGWGIRWGTKGKAYNVSGGEGVQLHFYDRDPLLIGSQNAIALYNAIKLAKERK
ncbi:DUF6141 family protein [uncultured Pontibacter sp.]|uniref:DUF6141 family protein n=1 Tax=uncultured Pontibacter sp. TaxID=453356 RepID=UPI00262A10BF|nr:DUF6141 family protein [uncultured Pontibacter sp.]